MLDLKIGRTRVVVAFVVLALATACASSAAPSTTPRGPDGRQFTAEAIQRSGATNAWQVLERLAVSLNPQRDAHGEPGSIGRSHPAMRYQSARSTLVVLDGFRIPDLRVLSTIPARSIASMRVLSMTRAQLLYGKDGWNGAIVIETFDPRSGRP